MSPLVVNLSTTTLLLLAQVIAAGLRLDPGQGARMQEEEMLLRLVLLYLLPIAASLVMSVVLKSRWPGMRPSVAVLYTVILIAFGLLGCWPSMENPLWLQSVLTIFVVVLAPLLYATLSALFIRRVVEVARSTQETHSPPPPSK